MAAELRATQWASQCRSPKVYLLYVRHFLKRADGDLVGDVVTDEVHKGQASRLVSKWHVHQCATVP